MNNLVPMSPKAYRQYISYAIGNYAKVNVKSGRWPKHLALGRSKATYKQILPKGLKTPRNFLFEIKNSSDSKTIGIVWYGIVIKTGFRSAFFYDIYIQPKFRRYGHAESAIKALENIVQAQGIYDIALHVFSHNKASLSLCKKLGYQISSVNLTKRLKSPRHARQIFPAGRESSA